MVDVTVSERHAAWLAPPTPRKDDLACSGCGQAAEQSATPRKQRAQEGAGQALYMPKQARKKKTSIWRSGRWRREFKSPLPDVSQAGLRPLDPHEPRPRRPGGSGGIRSVRGSWLGGPGGGGPHHLADVVG